MINERPHKKLVLWKESMQFVKMIYELTDSFPGTNKREGRNDSSLCLIPARQRKGDFYF